MKRIFFYSGINLLTLFITKALVVNYFTIAIGILAGCLSYFVYKKSTPKISNQILREIIMIIINVFFALLIYLSLSVLAIFMWLSRQS